MPESGILNPEVCGKADEVLKAVRGGRREGKEET